LGPDPIDVRESGKKILHHLETIVSIPVRILRIKNLDIGPLDLLHKRVETLIIDHGWESAEYNDISFTAKLLNEVLGRDFSYTGVVAGDV
jgi:hypothetical protein